MREVMYDKNSVMIAAILFVTMAVAIEVGGWLGLRLHRDASDALRTQVNSLQLMGDYVESRIAAAAVSLDREEARDTLLEESRRLQSGLWEQAVAAAGDSDRPATLNLYLQSLNEMIDSNSSRDAALGRHVPELVLFLLYGTFILTGALLGYASGISGRRVTNGTYVLVALIVILVFIIIDLDRPRRGLIEVDQGSLTDLRTAVHPPGTASP